MKSLTKHDTGQREYSAETSKNRLALRVEKLELPSHKASLRQRQE